MAHASCIRSMFDGVNARRRNEAVHRRPATRVRSKASGLSGHRSQSFSRTATGNPIGQTPAKLRYTTIEEIIAVLFRHALKVFNVDIEKGPLPSIGIRASGKTRKARRPGMQEQMGHTCWANIVYGINTLLPPRVGRV